MKKECDEQSKKQKRGNIALRNLEKSEMELLLQESKDAKQPAEPDKVTDMEFDEVENEDMDYKNVHSTTH